MRQVAGTLGVAVTLAFAAVLLTAGSAASSGVTLHIVARGGTVLAYGRHVRCHGTCSLSATPGSDVLLEATPNSFFSFSRWSGACHGTATACALSLTAARTARAIFTRKASTVLVTVGGAGSVRVAGLARDGGCAASSGSCYLSWPVRTAIKLAAVPAPGGSFEGWGGACAGKSGPSCRIVVGAETTIQQVAAAFATKGSGSGEQQLTVQARDRDVHSSLAGFSCSPGHRCSTDVAAGTLVKLWVTPGAAQHLSPWGGSACVGYGYDCAFVVDGPTNVTAPTTEYTAPSPSGGLVVVVLGRGVVNDATHKIKNCTMNSPQPNCQGSFPGRVRLRATPAASFITWRGVTCPPKRATCTTEVNGQSGATIVAVFKQGQ